MNGKEKTVLERLEKKIDDIYDKLLNPDDGLFHRVNENTHWRKYGQILLNTLLGGILLSVLALLFFVIRNGVIR